MDENQQDFLTEIINIGLGRAGSALSEMSNARVSLSVPNLSLCNPEELPGRLNMFGASDLLTVTQKFSGILSGHVMLVLSSYSGQVLTYRLFGGTRERDDLENEIGPAVTELGNVVIGHFVGAWSKMLCDRFRFAPPSFNRGRLEPLIEKHVAGNSSSPLAAVYADTHMDIPDFFVVASLITLFEQASLEHLIGSVASSGN